MKYSKSYLHISETFYFFSQILHIPIKTTLSMFYIFFLANILTGRLFIFTLHLIIYLFI